MICWTILCFKLMYTFVLSSSIADVKNIHFSLFISKIGEQCYRYFIYISKINLQKQRYQTHEAKLSEITKE